MADMMKTNENKGLFPDQQRVLDFEGVPDAIATNPLVATQTAAVQGDVPTLYVPFVETDPTADIVAEGAEIAESNGTQNQLAIRTHKIATLLKITNEAAKYTDAANMIELGAMRAMTAKADAVFLNATGSAGTPTGIAAMDGVTTVTPTKLTDLGAVLEVLSATTDLGASVTSMAMRYSTWARLCALTASDGRPLIAPDVTTTAAPMLYSVPVIVNNTVPADTILTFSAKDIVVSVSDIEAEEHEDIRTDSKLLRLTMRLGFGVTHAERIGKIVLPATK